VGGGGGRCGREGGEGGVGRRTGGGLCEGHGHKHK